MTDAPTDAPTDPAPATTGTRPSLYERLGGYDAISVFAAEALKKAMGHPDIGHI